MTTDPDPFEEGQRAARENIPAKGNPYRDGSEQHSLWAAGHESIAGEAEANESEGGLLEPPPRIKCGAGFRLKTLSSSALSRSS